MKLYTITENNVDGCGSDATSCLYCDPQGRDSSVVTGLISDEAEAFKDRQRDLRDGTAENVGEDEGDGDFDSETLFNAVAEKVGLVPSEHEVIDVGV